jgi:MFS family permease
MTVSLIGDGVTLVALAWQVYELSDAPTALGMIMMSMSIPQLLLLLFGGAISDRFERRWVMLGADLLRGLALTALGMLSLLGLLELWHIAVIAACYGAGSAFFGPAFDAVVPELVPTALLPQANALDQFVRPTAARLLGPALGGWIIAGVGIGWAFIIDAFTFAVSIACLLKLGKIKRLQLPEEPIEPLALWTEIYEGLQFVRSRTWLWGTFVAATLAYLVFLGPSEVLLPYVIKNELGGDASDLGMVLAMGGIGAIIASALMAQHGTPQQYMTFMYSSWSLATLMVVGYGLAQAPWHAMLACFAFNFFESAGLIVWITTKQLLVPSRLLGRVSSVDWFISIGLMPVSYAVAGPIAELAGARPTLIGAGILGAILTLAFLFLPGVRATERLTPLQPSNQPNNCLPTG